MGSESTLHFLEFDTVAIDAYSIVSPTNEHDIAILTFVSQVPRTQQAFPGPGVRQETFLRKILVQVTGGETVAGNAEFSYGAGFYNSQVPVLMANGYLHVADRAPDRN